ncbi:hypothetical protein [Aquibium sp. ELW1220]|uniref:hypothetical protein n=1 Tax=Aquibium sp. ELW1220 TaxID=2976766 RepID=UPI0025B17D95|nr:hypothetical protein [Aquibium sp. ELW1220]MDN2583734.1 hypothetical protein [Aquibium sp. ELW1220]
MAAPRVPKLIRFVVVNSLTGMLIGWLVAAGLIWFNIGGFGELVWHSRQRMVALFILAMSFGVTFAFAFLATALMLLPGDKDRFDRV